jgi:hypothetical protein
MGDIPMKLYKVFSRETTPSSAHGASKSHVPSWLHHLVHLGVKITSPWEGLMGNRNSITKNILGRITHFFVIEIASLG